MIAWDPRPGARVMIVRHTTPEVPCPEPIGRVGTLAGIDVGLREPRLATVVFDAPGRWQGPLTVVRFEWLGPAPEGA